MKRLNVNDLDGCTFMSSDLVTPRKNSDILVKPLNKPTFERRDTNADEGLTKMSGFIVTPFCYRLQKLQRQR